MKTRRNSVPPSVRLKVLIRDGFRCVYCDATKEDDRLEVDHVIPVSLGGTDDIGNLVVACRRCNIGKGKREVVDVVPSDKSVYVEEESSFAPDDMSCGEMYVPVPKSVNYYARASDIATEWAGKLRHRWRCVDGSPPEVEVVIADEVRRFQPSFSCSGRENSDIGPPPCDVHVLVMPWRAHGSCSAGEQEQIKRAVVAGYKTPTIIIFGGPKAFMAFMVHTKFKGYPVGHMVDQFLEPFLPFDLSGWYPDENDDFMDLCEAFANQPEQLQFRTLVKDAYRHRLVGVFCSYTEEAL